MRGQKVIVRGYGGECQVCIVWAVGESAIAVCSEEIFARLLSGKTQVQPVEVRSSDVFEFDPVGVTRVKHKESEEIDWSLFKPWTAPRLTELETNEPKRRGKL